MKKDVDDKLDIYKITKAEELLNYYQNWTKENKYNRDMIDLNYVAPKETVLLLKKYALNHESKILDAGCGTGLVGIELKKNGHIVIAESSRILVPYKKPIQMYFGNPDPDSHPFHFSKNSLSNLLVLNKFNPVFINRYIDSDYLVIIAKKTTRVNKKKIILDDYRKVKKFFISWYKDSKKYNSEIL